MTVRLPEKSHIETSIVDGAALPTILKADTQSAGLWVRNPTNLLTVAIPVA
jgi:hypothetical protein